MRRIALLMLLSATPAMAQSMPGMDMSHDMPGMNHDMPGMDMSSHGMTMHGLLGGYGMSREASGTSWQPEAAPHVGIMLMPGDDWMVMLHGKVTGVADWQTTWCCPSPC